MCIIRCKALKVHCLGVYQGLTRNVWRAACCKIRVSCLLGPSRRSSFEQKNSTRAPIIFSTEVAVHAEVHVYNVGMPYVGCAIS
jgi:hypothetical protein